MPHGHADKMQPRADLSDNEVRPAADADACVSPCEQASARLTSGVFLGRASSSRSCASSQCDSTGTNAGCGHRCGAPRPPPCSPGQPSCSSLPSCANEHSVCTLAVAFSQCRQAAINFQDVWSSVCTLPILPGACVSYRVGLVNHLGHEICQELEVWTATFYATKNAIPADSDVERFAGALIEKRAKMASKAF